MSNQRCAGLQSVGTGLCPKAGQCARYGEWWASRAPIEFNLCLGNSRLPKFLPSAPDATRLGPVPVGATLSLF